MHPTPGPWRHSPYAGSDFGICRDDGKGQDLAIVRGERGSEGEANAALIAAAPEMLDALLQLRTAFYVYGKRETLKKAFAATAPLLDRLGVRS